MGRYDFAPQRVLRSVARLQLYSHEPSPPPPWHDAVQTFPPAERLTRMPLQRVNNVRHRDKKNRSSKMFAPAKIHYPEDKLRERFFGDHPWELARPRLILEDDGKDYTKQKWQTIGAPGLPLNGESVVQRQMWLMKNEKLSKDEAYDKARKELYEIRRKQEMQARIAKEEAQHYGVQFDMGPMEVGAMLEDRTFQRWKTHAEQQSTVIQQKQASAYTGNEAADAADAAIDDDLDELEGESLSDGNPVV